MLQLSLVGLVLPCLLFLFMLIKIFNPNAARKSNDSLKLPPGPKRLPLIGNLHQLLGTGLPHNKLSNLAKIYGPIYHLKMGELTCMVLTTPQVVQEVLKAQELNFAQRPLFPSMEVMGYKDSSLIFAPYGEYWRQLRKICVLELLGAKRVRSFRSIRENEMNDLIDHVRSMQGQPFNLSNKFSSCVNSIIAKAAFGESCKQQKEYLSVLEEAGELASGFNVADLFPSLRILRYASGMKRKIGRVHRKFDKIMEDILNDRKKFRETSGTKEDGLVKEDLVDVLLRIQESQEFGFHLTTNNIKCVLLEIFGAGSDSSAGTTEWAMSQLLKNPRVMAKAQAEVREVANRKGHVQESDIEHLKYLKLVIKETLRMHPPAPMFIRETREGCKINGYEVPAKSRIIIHAGAIGRDPNHWKNPEKFEPERFLESSIDFMGTHYQFLPFGSGRRVCPGMGFASTIVELLLAFLLYHFDWTLPDGKTPEELDMTEAFAATIKRKNDLYVIATPHNHDSAHA